MEHEALRYSHEPCYGARGGRGRYHPEADERVLSHFVSPRETAYYQPDNYVFKRAPEAPYPYKASNEPPRHDSHSYYRRSPYSHNPSHPFLAAGERDRKDVHHDSYPPVMNIPPRPILHEGLPGRMHLPAPRPAVYNRDQRGVPSHYYVREMRESPPPQTVMTHYGARERQQDPPAQYKHSIESQTILRTPQCAEREIKPSKSTDSASTAVSAPDTVDDRQKPQKQEETGGEDHNVLQTPKNNDEKNRLSDALLLASVASMARSEIDTSGPLPPQPSIERTVSIEAKGSDRTDTPSPANVQDCKAVTPSLSTKFVQDVLLSSRSTKEDDISKEIKIKLSQVSDESTAATSSEPGLDSSPDRSQAQAPVLPRHPLSYSETAGQERKRSGPPPLPGQDALPRRRSKVEEQAGPAIPNDIEPPRQNPPHYPQDAYRRSYGHPGHVHEMHQDYYHMSHRHYEEEGRYPRYPSFQPIHHYHMPGYARDEQPPYHPGAQYHRSPYYHGMPPQHYADRRGMERPELRQEQYPAHDDYRPPLQYNKGHQPPNQGQAPPPNGKIILRRKCAWKNYPELEQFLIDNRDEYLRHSAMNYTQEQKQYNNDLTERLLEVATKHNYEFDRNDFNFVAIRDRIRCYYKSYVQNCKKRGITVGYSHKNAKKRKASEDEGSVKKEDDETPSVKDAEPEVKKVKTEEESVECNGEKNKKTDESIETGDKQAHTNGPDGKDDEGVTASEKRTEIVTE